jgi:polysaccharide export outer membrane protein
MQICFTHFYRRNIVNFFAILLAAVLFSSCASQHRLPYNYIINSRDTTIEGVVKLPEIKIQKNDQLSIQVYSVSLNPQTDAPFNLPGGASSSGTGTTGSSGNSGYLVDEKGNIEYPRIGTLHAEGLTKRELADTIKSRLTSPVKLLDNPSVIINFQNFKITVLGEVGHPGPVAVPTGHITILEAIGLAGDIPLTGKKTNVKVLREVNGNREIGTVNLTSDSVFNSPYYNLLQNDVVFVEVTKTKVQQSSQATLQRVTTVLGIITSLTLLYSIFKK